MIKTKQVNHCLNALIFFPLIHFNEFSHHNIQFNDQKSAITRIFFLNSNKTFYIHNLIPHNLKASKKKYKFLLIKSTVFETNISLTLFLKLTLKLEKQDVLIIAMITLFVCHFWHLIETTNQKPKHLCTFVQRTKEWDDVIIGTY